MTPRFAEAFRVWLKIGLLSFGGPAGQTALMHRILVEEKKWIDEPRFLHALNFCMLLPGPEAQQLATYIGWVLHRTQGALVAGLLFILPGALVMLGLSILYVSYADLSVVEGLFLGVKAAVVGVVLEAVVRISKRALQSRALVMIAAASFIAIFFFAAPFPAIIAAAAAIGAVGSARRPESFASGPHALEGAPDLLDAAAAFRNAAATLALWAAPGFALYLALGPDHVFVAEAAFFSKMAVVTFGGAYAVLAYVAQQAVETYQWLGPGEMMDGLGLAETTPGPLILVLEFVGFIAGHRGDAGLPPLAGGIAGAAIALWFTFAPCFFWIFLGAPFMERLRSARRLNAALAAITAAVVGVILNLALWFSVHVLFREVGMAELGPASIVAPAWTSLDPYALALSAAALIALTRLKAGMLAVLGGSAILGLVLTMARAV
jgi:chromate transporter